MSTMLAPVCQRSLPSARAAPPAEGLPGSFSESHTLAPHAVSELLFQKRSARSPPHTRLLAASFCRFVKIPPTVVRGSTSTRIRATALFAPRMSPASFVCRFRSPIENGPACPVRRPPPRMSFSIPMRRLKNASVSRRSPKVKRPARSRKNSRFSGKKRLKRVRFTWALSASAWAKSVFQVRSSVRFEVTEYFASIPKSLRTSDSGSSASRWAPAIAKGFSSMLRRRRRPSSPARSAYWDA